MKKYFLAFLTLFSPLLTACENTANTPTNNDNEKNAIAEKPAAALEVIGNRCIGCGKCARIDPEHFAMIGRKATVISEENTNSAAAQKAADCCPRDAIEQS